MLTKLDLPLFHVWQDKNQLLNDFAFETAVNSADQKNNDQKYDASGNAITIGQSEGATLLRFRTF